MKQAKLSEMLPEDLCWWYVNRNTLRGIQLEGTTLHRAPCRCLQSQLGKAPWACWGNRNGWTRQLLSWDLTGYPCAGASGEQRCSCQRSSSRGLPGLSVGNSTDHHGSHGQWESDECGLIVVTFPFQCELCPFPARLSIKGLVPLHSPCLCSVSLSPQLALSLPAAGMGAWVGRELGCSARAAGNAALRLSHCCHQL